MAMTTSINTTDSSPASGTAASSVLAQADEFHVPEIAAVAHGAPFRNVVNGHVKRDEPVVQDPDQPVDVDQITALRVLDNAVTILGKGSGPRPASFRATGTVDPIQDLRKLHAEILPSIQTRR